MVKESNPAAVKAVLTKFKTMVAIHANRAPKRGQALLLKATTQVSAARRGPSRNPSGEDLSRLGKVEEGARSSPDLTPAQGLQDRIASSTLRSPRDLARAPSHAQMPLLALIASEDLNLAYLQAQLPSINPETKGSVKRESLVAHPTATRSQDQDQSRVLAPIDPSPTRARLAQGLLPRRYARSPRFLQRNLARFARLHHLRSPFASPRSQLLLLAPARSPSKDLHLTTRALIVEATWIQIFDCTPPVPSHSREVL
jgi:hypothetical protein